MPLPARTDRLRDALDERDGDAVVLYPGPNTRYVADVYGEPLDRHFLVVVPAAGEPWAVTPHKSLDLLREESRIDRLYALESNDPEAVATRTVEELPVGAEALLLDDRVPFGVARPLRAAHDGSVDTAGPILSECRIRKEDEEIAVLDRSGAIADEVSEEIRALGADAIGRTESELAAEIRGRLHAKGGTRLSFDVVVASGPNAARPYYRSGDRRIREGEPVILDFGAVVDGYASDQTRTTVFAGEPPDRFEAAYDAVLAALERGIDAVEPGVAAGEVDRAANATIAEHGFEEHLRHATGHGVGLEAHEAPAIAEGNDRPLEPGMVFSVEPGVYVDGEFGVRIEELVAVTEDGCQRLNDSPRTWRPL